MRLLSSLVAAGAVLTSLFGGVLAASASSPEHNWSGFYAGGVASGGLYTVEQEDYWCFFACNAPTLQDWDASIGVQGGFNWQSGNLVLGVSADWSTGFEQEETVLYDATATPDGVVWDSKWNSYATFRGRAGLAAGNALVFATGGIAIVDVDYSSREIINGVIDCPGASDCAAFSDTLIGFTAGVGVGFPIADNLNLTFEYQYIGLPWDKARYDTAGPGTDDYVSWTTSAHLARVGVAWEFN